MEADLFHRRIRPAPRGCLPNGIDGITLAVLTIRQEKKKGKVENVLPPTQKGPVGWATKRATEKQADHAFDGVSNAMRSDVAAEPAGQVSQNGPARIAGQVRSPDEEKRKDAMTWPGQRRWRLGIHKTQALAAILPAPK